MIATKELLSALRSDIESYVCNGDFPEPAEMADRIWFAVDLIDQQAGQIETLREALLFARDFVEATPGMHKRSGSMLIVDGALSAPSAGWPEWLIKLTREIVILHDGDSFWAREQLPNIPQSLRDEASKP